MLTAGGKGGNKELWEPGGGGKRGTDFRTKGRHGMMIPAVDRLHLRLKMSRKDPRVTEHFPDKVQTDIHIFMSRGNREVGKHTSKEGGLGEAT